MKTLSKLLLVTLLSVTLAFGLNNTAQAATVHTVQSGDTMWKIAVKYQVGVSELIKANSAIKNPNSIYPGQKITIPTDKAGSSYEEQVVQLVNQERAKVGLKPLKSNWEVARVARYKSQDMIDKNYFSHTSPTYGSPFDMMKNFGITYSTAGENIAAGQATPKEVVNAWMNSEGHRKNILSSQFTEIGVGYAKGGSYGHYWTQMFISN
ncbi:SafA/ExsA family spore coat assembly protein [Priestia megaterium]|uniref:SafA/ExsA family spore coat assembly protein n=1 Tax=Priestia megaterium TaxID=1404 RepID=UPI0024535CAA|nr:SafA/ExsA family spore coat assembly protein [Priestia megaterium]MDH3140958.1 SafA/ExsA family spore coat assembly protein [Priestia megaterium]MED4238473.1 SafA/ExsA family spore coat assembly protein [Priestia megaterium]MED4252267.1 SafA/ExsA family spore coat assembly protein [Priestia megaterium]MED4264953.1 SafA/ExsA family spore coat assembly protein [Priestia megaterium]MED4277346.1 SafA/ExsA family spore coat assembly protein [Priestia megaterium]